MSEICQLCHNRKVHTIVEQPLNSLMFTYEPMVESLLHIVLCGSILEDPCMKE